MTEKQRNSVINRFIGGYNSLGNNVALSIGRVDLVLDIDEIGILSNLKVLETMKTNFLNENLGKMLSSGMEGPEQQAYEYMKSVEEELKRLDIYHSAINKQLNFQNVMIYGSVGE